MKKMTDKRLAQIENDSRKASPKEVRDFLKRKVGRQLIAIILGGADLPNLKRADAYLYKNAKLEEAETMKIDECYLVARIVDELRHCEKDIDEGVARNWLTASCSYLEDHAPICVIRDGRSYNHLTAVGAVKTFVLRSK